MPLKNRLYKIYLLIIGILIIFSHLYFRIFRVNEENTLEDLKVNLNKYILFVNIWFCVIHFLIVALILHSFYIKYCNINKESHFIKLVSYLSIIMDKFYWENLHDILAPDLPGSGRFMVFIAELIENGNKDLRYK
jgi:hypothetical protein